MINPFKKKPQLELIDNSKNNNLMEAYTDKLGNVYYSFIDPEIAPRKRIVYCERAARYAEMYISETNFKKAAKAMKEAANIGDMTKVFTIINEIEYCSSFFGEEESLLEVSAGFFLLKDEDPYEMYPKIISKKIDLWKNDKKAQDFFLFMGIVNTKSYSQKSPEDVLVYFDNPKYRERKQRLAHYIS